jgi:hypothetical protein
MRTSGAKRIAGSSSASSECLAATHPVPSTSTLHGTIDAGERRLTRQDDDDQILTDHLRDAERPRQLRRRRRSERLRARFTEPGHAAHRSLRGLGHTISSRDFDWLQVLRKEYGTPFAWLSGFLPLQIWEHQSPSARPISEVEQGWIAAIWITLAIIYMTVRTMKLRGCLGTT